MTDHRTFRSFAKRLAGRAVASRRIERYISGNVTRRMNIGCGYNTLPGWLNIDMENGGVKSEAVWMDASNSFPIPSNTFDTVLCEHMIEHLSKVSARTMIAEVFRVLKSGGKLRVITPDLDAMIALFHGPGDERARSYLDFVGSIHSVESLSPSEAINLMFYEYGHRYIYSIAELSQLLHTAGFADLVIGRGGYPSDPIFRDTEGHPNVMGVENNAFEAFAIEAVKPA